MKLIPALSVVTLAAVSLTVAVRAGGDKVVFPENYAKGVLYTTVDRPDNKQFRELYAPKTIMIPIGGHFTMGPREAALAVRLLEPQVVLPMHFGTFPPLKGTPDQLAKLIDPGVKVVCWKPGDEYTA